MKKPGTGHLFQRGETYWLEYTVDGIRFRQTLGTRDADEARREADKILEPHRAGTEADRLAVIERRIKAAKNAAKSGGPVALADAWATWEALDTETRRNPGPATLKQYKGQWSAFAGWMQESAPAVKTLATVKESHARRFVEHLKASGYSVGRVNQYKIFLRMFFRTMGRVGAVAENPFANLETQTAVQNSRQTFTVEEMRAIVSTAEGELKTLFLLGAGTGLRLADCCTLMWGECDLARRLIERIPRKTAHLGEKAKVKIGIPVDLAEHLKALPRRGPYVLPGLAREYDGGKSADVSNRIQAHLEACGIQTTKPGTGAGTGKRAVVLKGFHSFRHTYVSLNADHGTPQATMQKLVGHGNAQMTMRYLHPTDSMVLKAADSIPLLTGEIVAPTREPLPGWAVEIVKSAKSLKALKAALLG
ncbi:MAG: tyrosine-type recombinase/integrase [Kiritimatiellia bacterium]